MSLRLKAKSKLYYNNLINSNLSSVDIMSHFLLPCCIRNQIEEPKLFVMRVCYEEETKVMDSTPNDPSKHGTFGLKGGPLRIPSVVFLLLRQTTEYRCFNPTYYLCLIVYVYEIGVSVHWYTTGCQVPADLSTK